MTVGLLIIDVPFFSGSGWKGCFAQVSRARLGWTRLGEGSWRRGGREQVRGLKLWPVRNQQYMVAWGAGWISATVLADDSLCHDTQNHRHETQDHCHDTPKGRASHQVMTVDHQVMAVARAGLQINCCAPHPHERLIFVGTGTGEIYSWRPFNHCHDQCHDHSGQSSNLVRLFSCNPAAIRSVSCSHHWLGAGGSTGQLIGCRFDPFDESDLFLDPEQVVHCAPHSNTVTRVVMVDHMAISASDDCTVKLTDLQTGSLTKSLGSHPNLLRGLELRLPIVVSASWDGSIIATDLTDLMCQSTHLTAPGNHQGHVVCLGSSEHRVAVGMSDGSIFVYNLDSLINPNRDYPVDSPIQHDDDLVDLEHTVMTTPEEVLSCRGATPCFLQLPTDCVCVAGCSGGEAGLGSGEMVVWDLHTGREMARRQVDGELSGLQCSATTIAYTCTARTGVFWINVSEL
eukprot:TRINITY_DN25760_c0_g1_i5.p1 TRINITY_DN25760_c0_g1~~TRINITY_DN25760_c0_g1_i5.p1  ORF type:complete len:456 (-),score=45.60 TRINITY_DN25760_c0_g1_i5:129-1496(-)